MKSFTYFSADDFLQRKIFNFERNIPIIIDGIESSIFTDVKAKIIRCFGEDAVIVYVNNKDETFNTAAKDLQYVERLIIQDYGFLYRNMYTFGDLVEIIRRLRDEDGCPWDRVQTHESIRNNAIEEAYELAEAVDLHSNEKILEESGDVLLQGLFHAVIAEDNKAFTPEDMITMLCRKLVSRHTHIFGCTSAANAEEALVNWEQAKAEEKGQQTYTAKAESVPLTFGSLMRAWKVQKIIKKSGFDFDNEQQAKQKIFEELNELDEATDEQAKDWEAGDLLFATINYLRMLNIEPELALTATINRFIKRFHYVETKARENGIELSKQNMETLEKFYQESKAFDIKPKKDN